MIESTVPRIIARTLFIAICGVLSMAGGAIASILAIIVIVCLAVLYVLIKMLLSGGASGGGSRAKSQDDDYAATITDENGYERKLKDVGFGKYQDDKGDYWKSSGYNSVERDN